MCLHEVEDGFVVLPINRSVRMYSCYVSPNFSIEEYKHFLNRLETSINRCRQDGIDLIVANHFNARSAYWGDWVTGRRENSLCKLADATE